MTQKVLCLLIILHVGLLKSKSQDSIEIKNIELNEIVVKSFGLNTQKKQLGISIDQISNKTIKEFRGGEVSPVLNSVSGVYFQSGTQQTTKLTIRGIGSRSQYSTNRIKSYLNDIPLSSGDGSSIFDDLELFYIDNIEVFKGSQANLYGSGLGGSVRFNLSEGLNSKLESSLLLSTGSWGMHRLQLSTGIKSKDFSWRLYAGKNGSEGYRQNSTQNKKNILLHGKSENIDFIFSYSDVLAYTPSSIDSLTYVTNPSAAAANWLAYAGYKKYNRILAGVTYHSTIKENIQNQLTISGSMYDQYEMRPFNILDDKALNVHFRDQLKWKHTHSEYTVGIESSIERYDWVILNHQFINTSNGEEFRKQNNLFLNHYISIGKGIYLNTGINIHHNNYSYKNNSNNTWIFAPTLNLKYNLAANSVIFLSTGKGFSNPTMEESINWDGELNTCLKPETAWNLDLGVRYTSPSKKINSEINFYHLWLDNLLVTRRPSEDVFYGINAGESNLKGVEFNLRYNPSTRISTGINGSLSENKFVNFVHDEQNYSGKILPGIPKAQFNLFLNTKLHKKLDSFIYYRFVGNQYANDANSVFIAPWSTIDFKLSSNFRIKNTGNWEISTWIHNLTNTLYPSMILINAPSFTNRAPRYYYPGLPRNYEISLKHNFEIY